MKRIYYDKDTYMVSQIFDLTKEPELKNELNENTFVYCNMIDIEDDVEIGYNFKYNQETEEFEIDPDYVEVETIIEKSKVEELQEQLNTLQIATLNQGTLEEENKKLRNELAEIKKHLGLS